MILYNITCIYVYRERKREGTNRNIMIPPKSHCVTKSCVSESRVCRMPPKWPENPSDLGVSYFQTNRSNVGNPMS